MASVQAGRNGLRPRPACGERDRFAQRSRVRGAALQARLARRNRSGTTPPAPHPPSAPSPRQRGEGTAWAPCRRGGTGFALAPPAGGGAAARTAGAAGGGVRRYRRGSRAATEVAPLRRPLIRLRHLLPASGEKERHGLRAGGAERPSPSPRLRGEGPLRAAKQGEG